MEENHKGSAKTLAFRQARTAWANGSISFAHAESAPCDWKRLARDNIAPRRYYPWHIRLSVQCPKQRPIIP